MTDFFRGHNCTAQRLEVNPELDGAEMTVSWWLLNGVWHPLWPQFILSVVKLGEFDGRPSATLHFEGATHELVVMALNPGERETPLRYSAAELGRGGLAVTQGWLSPIDVVHQFTATDEEMMQLAELCAEGCTTGALNPSTDDNRAGYREAWLQACIKTLAHMRGEEHAP